MKTIGFIGVSGAGKTVYIAKKFYEYKMKGIDVAIIPDLVHFYRVEVPKNNLYDGGGWQEFSYFLLFLKRYTNILESLHILTQTKEHGEIWVDELPFTEWSISKCMGLTRYTKVMNELLEHLIPEFDELVFIRLNPDKNYKHDRKGCEWRKRKELFEKCDKLIKEWLESRSIKYREVKEI